MQVLATVLGGYFGSRLMQKFARAQRIHLRRVRRDGELSAGGISRHSHAGGTRDDAGGVAPDSRRDRDLRTVPVPDEELALVKNIMAGEMMRILDGPFGIADVTTENLLCGFGNAQTGRSLERIRRTTPDELLALAQKYLRTEDMVTVVAGDWE